MDTLWKEHERLAKKQKQTTEATLNLIDNVILQLNKSKQAMLVNAEQDDTSAPMDTSSASGASGSAENVIINNSTSSTSSSTSTSTSPMVVVESKEKIAKALLFNSKSVKDACEKVTEEHKDLHATVSKFGKIIDKSFVTEIERFANADAFSGTEKAMNEIIAKHLLRQGHFAAAETYIQESHLTMDQSKLEPFIDMYNIVEAIKKHDLAPALKWAKEHRAALENSGSNLEFKLHKLEFIRCLQLDRTAALNYARENFEPFSGTQLKEIQRLLGCLLYFGRASPSPYTELLDPIHWTEIAHAFTRDCCALLGMPYESPLYVSVSAGCTALPTLLKVASVLQNKTSAAVWASKDELPVEIDLGKEYQFHSVFACPVSKEQSTAENPPMMMACGHVVCKLSLDRLSKNGGRFKCPYCPMEQSPADAKIVYF